MSATDAELKAGFAAQTIAQQFVDELTFLKLLRIKGDDFDYAYLGGRMATEISNKYGNKATVVKDDPAWLAHGVTETRTFADGSVAIRFAATMRWEAYRTW